MAIGSVLIADDEETFRDSISRLLRYEGFECQCANDGTDAVQKLGQQRYDAFICDIRMPRNLDLSVVRDARKIDDQLSIILVTGYPTTETAIRGIDMAVDAYLTKPVAIEELTAVLHKSIERSQARRRMDTVLERLRLVVRDLEAERAKPPAQHFPAGDGALPTIRALAMCLSDLLVAYGKAVAGHKMTNLCQLLDCPQQPVHLLAIHNAIDVLERTKDNFKSRQLAELRVKLEDLVGTK